MSDDFRARFWGDPKLRASYAKQETKGNLIAARRRYVLARWGDSAVQDVARRLSTESSALFLGEPLPFSWYPLVHLLEIDEAIAEGPMNGELEQMKQFGEVIARYDLSTLYKVFFKLGTPAFVLRRINIAYSMYMRPGSMHGETDSPTTGRVTFTMGQLPRYLCEHGITGWFTAALELSGATRVNVVEVDCQHRGARACRWTATWSLGH